jgi:hypothetical protein
MTLSRTTALLAAAALALPGSAFAAKHKQHVHRAVSPPQPTIVVPHRYDAGGDGGEAKTPAGITVRLFDPAKVALGLGNKVLAELGLPPLPAV